jgi:hypothetical protein
VPGVNARLVSVENPGGRRDHLRIWPCLPPDLNWAIGQHVPESLLAWGFGFYSFTYSDAPRGGGFGWL